MIGLGCMRLSTVAGRDDARAVAVIHAALDAGATLLDTADAYALGERDVGHNERLVAHALRTWTGDATTVTVATKGGLRRPRGRWVPDGRAKHLRAACDASRAALGVETIDLYQLHVIDPRTPLETSVRALAALRADGSVRDIGLCNVNVAQIEAARAIVDIAAVQVSLSPFDDDNLRNGVAEYCRDHGIRLIAYRPFGGDRAARLARDETLAAIAAAHDATPYEVALAWLVDLDDRVLPIPGATRIEAARSIANARALRLSDDDRARLDARFPAGRMLRVPRALRRPPADADGDVVLVMGMPGAGKSTVAHAFVERGYERLNRDARGGRTADLLPDLEAALAAGRRRWVLDNTYPTRKARNEVIETAWRHRAPVRCVVLDTDIADAQINAVTRMLDAHRTLPTPDELKAIGRRDPRFFGPDAQFRWERTVEPPVEEEGFTRVERRPFVRRAGTTGDRRAVILEYDDVLCTSAAGQPLALDPDDVTVPAARAAKLRSLAAADWLILALAWRPQLDDGSTSAADVQACFDRTRALLDTDIDIAHCPHPAGPPICWCRKPLPGLVLEFARRRDVDLQRSTIVGRSPADRTMATKLKMNYHDHEAFFS